MEDLDGPRAQPRFVDQALRDLEWLGLDWDGEVLLQSSGLPRLSQALEQLVRSGDAYACICSRGEVRAAASAPQAGVGELSYPGTCRGRFASAAEAERRTGRQAGYRFRVPPGSVAVDDGFSGRHLFDVEASVGDFIIGRRDGTPAYQLAVVVDDAAQGVSEVVRGDDLLASTARQVLLQRALGLPTPAYVHLPLVVDASGRRLAKRHNDLSLYELSACGIDARRLVHWVATSAGIACPEPLSARECLPLFSLERVPRGQLAVNERTLLSEWLGGTSHR